MTPRTTLVKTTLLGPYPALQPAANALDVTFAAADLSGAKNQFAPSGDDLLLVWNTDVATPYTFTLTSAVDDKNRTGDITTYSVGAGEIAAIRVKIQGWTQTDGKVYLEASNVAIKFAVIGL
jgi:hypothetical protein